MPSELQYNTTPLPVSVTAERDLSRVGGMRERCEQTSVHEVILATHVLFRPLALSHPKTRTTFHLNPTFQPRLTPFPFTSFWILRLHRCNRSRGGAIGGHFLLPSLRFLGTVTPSLYQMQCSFTGGRKILASRRPALTGLGGMRPGRWKVTTPPPSLYFQAVRC